MCYNSLICAIIVLVLCQVSKYIINITVLTDDVKYATSPVFPHTVLKFSKNSKWTKMFLETNEWKCWLIFYFRNMKILFSFFNQMYARVCHQLLMVMCWSQLTGLLQLSVTVVTLVTVCLVITRLPVMTTVTGTSLHHHVVSISRIYIVDLVKKNGCWQLMITKKRYNYFTPYLWVIFLLTYLSSFTDQWTVPHFVIKMYKSPPSIVLLLFSIHSWVNCSQVCSQIKSTSWSQDLKIHVCSLQLDFLIRIANYDEKKTRDITLKEIFLELCPF